MVPVIELKGAIPLIMSTSLWGEYALSPLYAWASATIGGIIASILAVLLFLPLRRILEKIKFFKILFNHCDKGVTKWLVKRLNKPKKHKQKTKQTKEKNTETKQISFVTEQTKLKSKNKTKDNALWGKFWIAFVFCALPIPFSGVWSAGALCSVLKLNFGYSVLAIATANTICSIFIGLFCTILSEFVDLVICILCVMLVYFIIYQIIKIIFEKQMKKKEQLSID